MIFKNEIETMNFTQWWEMIYARLQPYMDCSRGGNE